MEVPERDAARHDWPLSPVHKDRLEFVAERLYDARETMRKVLAKDALAPDAVANAALDISASMLILREIGVAVPVPSSGAR